jgi:hypothetical protein
LFKYLTRHNNSDWDDDCCEDGFVVGRFTKKYKEVKKSYLL